MTVSSGVFYSHLPSLLSDSLHLFRSHLEAFLGLFSLDWAWLPHSLIPSTLPLMHLPGFRVCLIVSFLHSNFSSSLFSILKNHIFFTEKIAQSISILFSSLGLEIKMNRKRGSRFLLYRIEVFRAYIFPRTLWVGCLLRHASLWWMGSLSPTCQRGLLDIIEEENSQRKRQDIDIEWKERKIAEKFVWWSHG